MKRQFIFLCINLFLMSCDAKKIAAGAEPYAERVKIDCPVDSIIHNLRLLKSTEIYNHINSFPDGINIENSSLHDFYFYSRETDILLHLDVSAHNAESTDLRLINIKDFRIGDRWYELNRNVSADRKKQLEDWFNKSIKPKLYCN